MKKLFVCVFVFVAAFLLAIGAFASETVIYENDFSNSSTLSDFTQYRHAWEIKDGGLYATSTVIDSGTTDGYSHILFNPDFKLTDYIAEIDYMNAQVTGGLVFNADMNLANHTKNGFYG